MSYPPDAIQSDIPFHLPAGSCQNGPTLTHLGKGIVLRKFVLAAVLVLMAGGAQAATLNVVGGQLMGASNVLVDGNLYDVQFLDGTCIDLYNGCDAVSDFTFQTEASATLAAQALLDQVFLDVAVFAPPSWDFDSQPWLTNGCVDPAYCGAETPYALDADAFPPLGDNVIVMGAYNFAPGTVDQTGALYLPRSVQVGCVACAVSQSTYAVWSPIPEPSTALMVALGLTGLAAKGRRRNSS